MGRRKVGKQNMRKLSVMGNGSYYVTIPIADIRELEWRERQNLTVRREGKKLIVEDWED